MMGDHPTITSPDGSRKRNPPRRCSRPPYNTWDSSQEYQGIPQEHCSQDSIKEPRETPQKHHEIPKTHPLHSQDCVEEHHKTPVVMAEPHFKEEEEEVPIATSQDGPLGNALQGHLGSLLFKKDEEETEYDEGDSTRVMKVIIKSETKEEEEMVVKKEEEVIDMVPVDLQKRTPQNYETSDDTKSNNLLTVWKPDDVSRWGTQPMKGPKIMTINHRTKVGDKPFSCPECGGFFKQKSSLVLHRRIHSGEKPYSCSECGKQFIQKANYLRHQRLHTGEKPYKCTECGKEYAQKQSLVMHQKFHAENEPFSCPECGANFIRQSHLVNHRKTHRGLRRYTCPDCGDFFMLRSSLVIHQRVHSAEKPFTS